MKISFFLRAISFTVAMMAFFVQNNNSIVFAEDTDGTTYLSGITSYGSGVDVVPINENPQEDEIPELSIKEENIFSSETEVSAIAPMSRMSILAPVYSAPRNGLMAEYLFDGNGNDSSGNNNNGIVYGSSYTPGVFGNALLLKNSNNDGWFNKKDYVKLPNASLGDFSVSLWTKFYRANNYDPNASIFSIGDANVGPFFWIMTDSNQGNLRIEASSGGTNIYASPTYNINDNKWHQISVVKSQNSIRVYLDNRIISETVLGKTLSFKSAPMYIGYHQWYGGGAGSSRYYGIVDNVRVYNRPLTTPEVGVLYNEGKTIPLSFLSSTPVDNSIGIPTNTLIALNFSKPLDQTTVPGNIVLRKTGGDIVHTEALDYSGSSIRFYSTVFLEKNTSYTVELRTGLRDTDGGILGNASTFSFTTGTESVPFRKLASPIDLHQQIQSPLLEIQSVNQGEKIGKYQSGSGLILSARSGDSGISTKLEFEVSKAGDVMSSYNGSGAITEGSGSTTMSFRGAGEYAWKVRSADDIGNVSDWVSFSMPPWQYDFAFYDGFEPYPYGYSFYNRGPAYFSPLNCLKYPIDCYSYGNILDGGIAGGTLIPYTPRIKVNGNKWDIFEAAFKTDWSGVGEIKMLDAFEYLGLNDNSVAFQGGNCYGMATSAAMQYSHPDFLQNNFPDFSSKVGTGRVWDNIEKLDLINIDGIKYWKNYNSILETILTFQLMQYNTNQYEKVYNYTGVLNVYDTLRNNPGKTFVLSFWGTQGESGLFSNTGTVGHAVIPYKVEATGEGKKIYFWDNNVEYPENNKRKAYDQYIEIKTDGSWIAPLYIDEWKSFDKMSLVSLDDIYNQGKKSPPIGLNQNDTLYTLSSESDLRISDSEGRISGFSGGTILEEVPGVQVLTPLNATLSGTIKNTRKQIYLPQKISGLMLHVVGKAAENYNLMIAGGDYYTKISGVSMSTGQIDTYTSTNTGISIDFDNTKIGTYGIMTDNFQNSLTGTIFLSGITIIPQPQKCIYDWNKALKNDIDTISYQTDIDSDGIYDISSNFSAVPKSLNEKGSISGYVKGDTSASMAGWKVFIDKNSDGKLQENSESFQVTDNKGYYRFNNLEKGNYTIIEIPHQNWNILKQKYNIILNNGQNVVNLNFENSFTKGKNK